MDTLTRGARVYLLILTLSAVVLTALLTLSASREMAFDSLHFGLILALALLAYRFPISFGFKRRIYLDVVAIGCGVMLLAPGPAALAIGLGALGGQLLKSRDWSECSFNASQAMLQTIAGGLLLAELGWEVGGFMSLTPATLPGLIALTLTIYAINSVLLAGIIGIQSGIPPLKVLVDSGTSIIELAVQATQIAAAVIATLLITTSVLLAALLLVPCGALHIVLKRNVQKQKVAIIGMLDTLADLVDFRDPYTATHARRVAEISRKITRKLDLPQEQVDLISMAARYHNLGSLTIPDQAGDIVGGLHSDAWNIMRQVPSMSADLLYQFPETALAGDLVKHHLERFDGEGYPDGLAGDAIPLGSRIVAVADSLDSMMRHRPYRPALLGEELRIELELFRGSQWDPNIIDLVLAMLDTGELRLALQKDDQDDELLTQGHVTTHTIEQQIQHQAFHDPLTDLPNRLLLTSKLSRGLTGGGRRFAVLFIDLDGFKSVNDQLGHRAGDRVLIAAARRIRAELHNDDLLARLGGDEFVVLLWDVQTSGEASVVAQHLIEALEQPGQDIDASIALAASIGIALARPGY